MSITVKWENLTRTLIRVVYDETWTWEEWLAVDRRVQAMLDEASHPVGLIYDARHTQMPNDTLRMLPQVLGQSHGMLHTNAGQLIIVGQAEFLEIVVSIFKRVYSLNAHRISHAPTMAAAYVMLGHGARLTTTGSLA